MANQIHPTAIVSPEAELGDDNQIGPYAIVEDGAVMGDRNRLDAHSMLRRGARIGHANRLHPHAVVGDTPQDLGFQDGETYAQLGDHNVLREYVTVHRASLKEGGVTRLGNHNYLMVGTHIAHDCQLADHITIAPYAGLGGHVHVGERAFISGGVMVHQFVAIGTLAMIGGNSKITQDCLPYMITDGNPAAVRGLNSVGLRRAGFDAATLRSLKEAYRILFEGHGPREEVIARLDGLSSAAARHIAEFLRASRRAFHRAA